MTEDPTAADLWARGYCDRIVCEEARACQLAAIQERSPTAKCVLTTLTEIATASRQIQHTLKAKPIDRTGLRAVSLTSIFRRGR